MKRLGLVTVLYNSADVLPGFFASLASQTDQDWHLEVIDNSPNESSMNRARELASAVSLRSVHFVRNPDNYGVAKANNQGIRNCLERGCDGIILLNNDIEFDDPELLESIRREMANGGYALLAPRVHYHDTGRIWYGGGSINLLSATVCHDGDHQEAAGRFLEDFFTGYAPTCFMAIRADVFEAVGLMDERYFVYYDDTDFVLRCLRQGLQLRYMGRRALSHKVSSSTGGGSSHFSIYYYNRNRLFFIRKNLAGATYGIALAWYFLTRLYKLGVYSRAERDVLKRAMRDGMSLA